LTNEALAGLLWEVVNLGMCVYMPSMPQTTEQERATLVVATVPVLDKYLPNGITPELALIVAVGGIYGPKVVTAMHKPKQKIETIAPEKKLPTSIQPEQTKIPVTVPANGLPKDLSEIGFAKTEAVEK
jgi:hypothetical protein